MPAAQSTTITVEGNVITVFFTPIAESWRLVHDGVKVINLFKASGRTTTRKQLFYGTVQQCVTEAQSKSLTGLKPFIANLVEDELRNIPKAVKNPLLFSSHVISELVDSGTLVSSINTAINTVQSRIS